MRKGLGINRYYLCADVAIQLQHKFLKMENNQIQTCIDACETCADACETCSTENKGKAGMEHSVKLCIACADACNALIAASKTNACRKCAAECEAMLAVA